MCPHILHTIPTNSSTDIEASLLKPEISPNIVTAQAVKQTLIGSPDCTPSTPIVSLAIKTASVPDQTVSCAKQKTDESSLVVSFCLPNDDQNTDLDIQSISQIREALSDSNVLVHQYHQSVSYVGAESDISAKPASPSREEMLDQVVEAYAARLRRVLSRSGRKPAPMAGLRLYSDLLALLGSLETSLSYLEDEPRLTCFADAIREALLEIATNMYRLRKGILG